MLVGLTLRVIPSDQRERGDPGVLGISLDASLAFDTIYAEGQRRYVESLSSYARQFLEMQEKPDVEVIEGLSPAAHPPQHFLNFFPLPHEQGSLRPGSALRRTVEGGVW